MTTEHPGEPVQAAPAGHAGPAGRAARGDTRQRIQEVALELFAEQGYEATSLREISDRLGVTKAALYYHFKSKEEIVASTVHDFLHSVEELVDWGQQQPRTVATKREVLRRYADIVQDRWHVMRFFRQNPSGADRTAFGGHFKDRMMSLQGLLYDDGDPLAGRIRAIAAVMGMHVGLGLGELDVQATAQECRDAALEVAYDLIDPPRRRGRPAGPARRRETG